MHSDSYEVKFLKQTQDLPKIRSGKSPNQSSVAQKSMATEEKRRKAALQEGERRGTAEREGNPLKLLVPEKPSGSAMGSTTVDSMVGMIQLFQMMMLDRQADSKFRKAREEKERDERKGREEKEREE